MASMLHHREQYAKNPDKYTFASSPSYQGSTKSLKCMGNNCRAAGGSAKSLSDSMDCFRCDTTKPTTNIDFGLTKTRHNDSTAVAAGIDYDNSRPKPNFQRYPSPVRHSMRRKEKPSSHVEQPQPDFVLESKTPFYDQAFQSSGPF